MIFRFYLCVTTIKNTETLCKLLLSVYGQLLENPSFCCIIAVEGEWKMKSKDIKRRCNKAVIALGIISIIALFKFSDLPNFFNIKFLEKPLGNWSILISILTSYVVTVGFYIVMNLIPDVIKEQEDIEHLIPYRCCMHRDIQLFLSDVLFMWSQVINFAAEKCDEIDTSKIESISKMFSKDVILNAASQVGIFESSNITDVKRNELTWGYIIVQELSKINNRGEKILEKYSKDIPTNVYYSLNYLMGACPIIGLIYHTFSVFLKSGNKQCKLSHCIAYDASGKLDLKKTATSIECIYNWVNEEYEKLMTELDESNKVEIYQVDLKTYFK